MARPSGSPNAPPEAAVFTKAPLVPSYSFTVLSIWLVTNRLELIPGPSIYFGGFRLLSPRPSPRRHRHFAGLVPRPKRRQHILEKARRQIAVVVLIRVADLAQIIARPDELISLADDHP